MKTNDLIRIVAIYQVIIKDTLDASSYVVHHCLTLKEATNIAMAMVKSGFEAFIKEDDDTHKMFYTKIKQGSEIGKVCDKMTKRFTYNIPHISHKTIDGDTSSTSKSVSLYELALKQQKEFNAAMH